MKKFTISQRILIALYKNHHIVRFGSDMWRWQIKWDGRPPLKGRAIQTLFLRNAVAEVGTSMHLTETGRRIAEMLLET